MTTEQEWFPSTGEPQGGDSPLLDFEGVLAAWERIEREFENRTYRVIKFKFTAVRALDATEPYPFPVAEININFADPVTDRGNSRWAHWSTSARNITGQRMDAIKALVGKRQRWKRIPKKIRQQVEGEWVDAEVPVWTIIELEGSQVPQDSAGNVGYVLGIANGKTETEFYQAALEDQRVMRDPVLVTALTNRSFVSQMLEAGQLERNSEGVLSVKS